MEWKPSIKFKWNFHGLPVSNIVQDQFEPIQKSSKSKKSYLLVFMGRESNIIQQRRLQPQQYRAHKVTKSMVPTPNTYSLRSHGLPTMNKESPVRTPNVSTKAIENEEIEAQVAAKTVIDAFQPLVNALTS